MRRRRILALLLALAVAGACELAHADEPSAAPAPAAPAYTLEVDSDAPDVVSYEALAPRVASDLGADVAPPGARPPSRAALVVRFRSVDRSLSVRAAHAGGRVLERTVRAEGDPANVQNEAALLASNLARDEARELLDALTARPPPPPPTPAPPPPAPPAVEPPPVPQPGPPPPRIDGEVIASVALVYPIATNVGRPRVASAIDLSLGFGRVGGVNALQLGVAATYASEYVHGAQISAAVGITRELRGAQFAPVNVAEDVEGAQVGVVNVARRVKGAQIGVVNVAEDVDGAAIGVVSVTRSGIHPIAWTSNLSYANAGVKFATKYVYTVLATQYGSLETELRPRFGSVGGLGVHLPIGRSFDVEAEGAIAHITTEDLGSKASNTWIHARVLPGWSFGPHLRVFAGGGFRAPFTDVDLGRRVIRPEFVGGLQL